ncbi:hypothetical protein NDU88_004475 [Pleurodeles waltl]|uniref:Midasin n=1 Tax=Pleurodeles waltl TaxID=8319 RepID=A0AAV7RIC8_PLEWA|nr:hypothetical protein NDU88_004475 [Pleurodeles waltl]
MENLQLSLDSLQLIAARNEKSSTELRGFLAKQVWSQQDRQAILNALAQLLLDKECTLLISRQLRPLLLDLLERNAVAIKGAGQINHDLHERLCVAMGKLITSHPDVLPFALRYFKGSLPVFQRLFLESSDASTVRYGRKRMKLRDLMEAAYRFLQHDRNFFSEIWDWSVCAPLLRSHDTLVRWYTANCLALVTCMSDGHKKTFLKKILNPEELINFRLKTLEEMQMQNVEKALVLANPDTLLWQREKGQQYTQGQIVSGDLSDKVVAVCGVVLAKQEMSPKDQDCTSRLVLVESTCRNLQSLALAVSFQKAVLLEGPIGCGKTALVEYISAVTGRTKSPDILKVQLGDQTDSKMLLGMYRCTDVPGEFVWQPGSLTQAVTKGHWILLEDIDYAPLDVISVLIPLLENGELMIPGRGDCFKVSPGFQFFATRRLLSSGTGWYRQQNSHAPLLDKYWTKIQLDNMNRVELKEILLTRYPSLTVVTDRLLDIYIQLTGDKHQKSDRLPSEEETLATAVLDPGDRMPSLEGRGLSLRDLLKWCNRIAHNFDSTSPDTALNVFHEALDCFTAMLSNQASRLKMAESIGSKLNISRKKAEFYCHLYKPAISLGELLVSTGRIEVPRIQEETVVIPRDRQTFAATRPSSVLLEQLSVCIDKEEPVLLVGETGTGKTSTVQYLANMTGHRLRVVNMNQQSDTADLLGGYKPVDHRLIWLPMREVFEELFTKTFSRKQNATFLGHIQTCYRQRRWHDLLKLMQHVLNSAILKIKGNEADVLLKEKWESFSIRLNQAQQQMKLAENALMFAFVEGTLAKAVKKGDWILLDEINLATAETLECLSGLLEGSSGSLVLLDRGDTEPLMRHNSFRLFACMNPATDIGKRNLPPGIRNRFTELYVDELEDENDLQILVTDYLKGLNVGKNMIQGIISFYLSVRKISNSKLVDGTGHRPHYSLRTLCRALRYAATNPCNSIQRSLYEGFCLGFLTQLDRVSHPVVQKLICQHIVFCSIKNLTKQPLPEPKGGHFKQMEGYWIPVGDKEPAIDESYILTPSVTLNLKDLARVVSAGTYPVLIQGETSVGKTSLIQWLASATGNHCVRINNHEHTDIQEYIGFYSSNASGKLVFNEGVLIDAMRKGYWIILDELNLAPTDVLEALNRLLDDNRELFVTETQEVVKAHPRFMLFATQNPPGAYGGRKALSRAFRNRFVELHFNELPSSELETILNKRCCLPPSYCSKLVNVMLALQSHRRGSTVFAGKYGFITLRDLFRWAERYRLAEQLEKDYDWLQHLADDGFMLLAGRVRKPEEEVIIHRVIEKHFKRKINPQALFSDDTFKRELGTLFSAPSGVMENEFSHIVWTGGMRRLAVLVGRALKFGEPILLVGDTGCGKTTICQLFAAMAEQTLYSVNCHMHMETSDFLGGLRPVRQRSKDKGDADQTRLFEWHDGPLVLAMKEEGFFLMDEISLADDSVLERLNSVLEVEKTLVLAEKGSQEEEENEVELLTAGKKFRIVATMNPGGDFGKKELSPALRNRFTEIWCPQSNSREDLMEIIKHNLRPGLSLDGIDHKGADIAALMMDFIEWLMNQEYGRRCILSVRDILSWVNFMNVMMEDEEPRENSEEMEVEEPDHSRLSPVAAFIHAACLVYIDGLGAGTTSCSATYALQARKECLLFLSQKLSAITLLTEDIKNELSIYDRFKERKLISVEYCFGIHPFYIPIGPKSQGDNCTDYDLSAGTTSMNAQRLLRALKVNKPVLLEGSPGVGKTSLVAALAKSSGNKLVRINLSEQTDVTDLFGTDLPVEGGKGGDFSWRDGPLLAALKLGHWIVLDELNLASQSVLEGLNACFDHRAEIYVPELGMSFQVEHEKTKIFGCQNPFRQGGGRKGLPKSFLNRFTQVYIDPLTVEDMECIGNALFPAIGSNIISKMVAFNNKIEQEVMVERKWGQKGGPWEFNLRDLFRWCQLILVDQSPGFYDPGQHVFLVYGERMRTMEDRNKVVEVFKDIFGQDSSVYMGTRYFHTTIYKVQIGYSILSRGAYVPPPSCEHLALLHRSLQPLESIMKCVQMSSMVILAGPSSVGKTSLVHLLAQLTGHRLKVMAMNSAMDTTELLGGFEQADLNRPWQCLLEKVEEFLSALIRDSLLATDIFPEDCDVLLRAWSSFSLHCKSKSVDDCSRNNSADLLNKVEGILGLIHRMNKKTNSFSKTEFASLATTFQNFKDQLNQSSGRRNLGTFEWVDGMLVQALQSGDWLLMDNVNFCSASVLDRLNALLEPGGVLTVSERGVIDGSTITITPHSSFRLFLSMDPAHGEISRAMRNRGIEVFIPGDNDDNELDQFDLKLLLHGFGLVGDAVCDKLMAVHKEIKETVVGSPASSLTSLISVAMLITQQLQRGFGLMKAFQRACWEVYACSQPSQSLRKCVEEIIQKHISTLSSIESYGNSLLALGLWPDTVPSVLLSAEDSALSTVFHDGQVLAYCLNRLNLKSGRILPLTVQDLQKVMQSTNPDSLRFSPVEMEAHWMEEIDVIAAAVKLVTEKAAFSDWMLRVRWLNDLNKKIPHGRDPVCIQLKAGVDALNNLFSSSLSDGIRDVIKRLQPNMADVYGIPLDLRWNMQRLDIMRNCTNFDVEVAQRLKLLTSLANRSILFLNREKQTYIEKMQLNSSSGKKMSRASAFKLSTELHKDPGIFNSLPHAIVSHLAVFFELWDALLLHCVQSNPRILTDEAIAEVQSRLHWRDRFWSISNSVSVDSVGLALLSLHWHWLEKLLIEKMPPMLTEHENHMISQEIKTISLHIQTCLSSPSGASMALKRLQKMLGRPLPYKEKSVGAVVDQLKVLGQALQIVDVRPVIGEHGWQRDIYRLQAVASGWDVKEGLLRAWGMALTSNYLHEINTGEIKSSVDQICSKLKEDGILSCHLEAVPGDDVVDIRTDTNSLIQLSSRVQTWPAMEYLALLWQYKLTVDIIAHVWSQREKNNQGSLILSELSQHAAYCLKLTPASAQHLKSFWYLLHLKKNIHEDVTLLWSDLLNSAFETFWSSTVTTDPEYWSLWKPEACADEKKKQKSLLDPSVKGPGLLSTAVLSKCFFEIFTSSNNTLKWDVSALPGLLTAHVTLGEWLLRTQQLEDMSTALWTNFTVSSLAAFRNTDARLQGLLLCRQLTLLKPLLPSHLQADYLQNCEMVLHKDIAALRFIKEVLEGEVGHERIPDDLISILLTCVQQFFGEGDEIRDLPELAKRGCLWVNMGLLQIQVWLPQTTFDSAVKKEYKLKYAKEELYQLECEWKTRNLSAELHTGRPLESSTYSHPHIRILEQRMQRLREHITHLSKKQAYRPEKPSYVNLYQEIQNYVESIAQVSHVQDLAYRLTQMLHGNGPKSRQSIQNLLNEEATWQQSHHKFRKKLAEDYALYPDAAVPLQAAILQMQHGMRLMAAEVYTVLNSSLVTPAKLTDLITSLIAFPSVSPSFPSYLSHADVLCSVKSLDSLRGIKQLSLKYSTANISEVNDPRACPTKEQLLVNALLYLRSHVLCVGEMDQKSLKLFRHICQAIINEWDEQESCERKREAEESSLYKTKSRSHVTEKSEDEDEKEFRMRFPVYDKDFADITSEPSLEEEMETNDGAFEVKTATTATTLLSQGSMLTVMQIHQQLCLSSARAFWYQQSTSLHQAKYYLSTFLSCYQTSSAVIAHFYPMMDAGLNEQLLGSLLLASKLLRNAVSGDLSSDLVLQHESSYDFYQHPNLEQVRQCQPVLNEFTKEVKQLLEKWCEHPALTQLLVVMDRIRGFPLSSPLSKFLNGLEILLNKSQDWEENASRDLSLRKHLDAVTQLIIQWRKLELNCWSLGLNNAVQRHALKSSRYWFSIYELIENYMQDQLEENAEGAEKLTLPSVVSTLKAFIEGATLGEFNTRLQMLLVFHCHVLLMPQIEGKDSLCSVLWNLYNYYVQFSDSIQTTITLLRQPLEKELKEFVNISKWNDVSFWSIKQSVEKTHRTLFKYMKKFEASLCEPCRPALAESTKEEQLDCLGKQEGADEKETKVQRLNSLLKTTIATKADIVQDALAGESQTVGFAEESLQHRLPKLIRRMKKLCTRFMRNNPLPDLVNNLDEFTGGVITSVHDLQAMTVDLTVAKEKLKSDVKHMLVHKQRALSDLFKMLTQTGLSYRKGLTWARSKDAQEMLYLRPLNLRSALSICDNKDAEQSETMLLAELSSAWDGCEKYFYRSLARDSRLQTAMSAPAKELGLSSIERCKGFTAHILKMLIKQRSSLSAMTEQWVTMRNILTCLKEISSRMDITRDYNIAFPPQAGVQQWAIRLQNLAMQCIVMVEQLSWFIQCCPNQQTENCDQRSKTEEVQSGTKQGCSDSVMRWELKYPSPVAQERLPPMCKMRMQDPAWQKLSTQVSEMLTEMKIVKAEVDKIRRRSCEPFFYSWKDFEVCAMGLNTLMKVSAELQNTESLFCTPELECSPESQQMVLIKSLQYIQEEVKKAATDFSTWKTQLFASAPEKKGKQKLDKYVEAFSDQVESTILSILCAIQSLVEKNSEKEQANTTASAEEVNEEKTFLNILKPGIMTKLLSDDLTSDIRSLQVQKIISAVSELLEKLKLYCEDCQPEKHKILNQSCGLLVRLIPMLSTYLDLLLFYLTVSLGTHRGTGKLLTVLAHLFTELAQKGFCLPKELMEEEAGNGATEFHDYEGGGIGEGEGKKDVSDKIENEEQVEDSHRQGEEKEKEKADEQPDIKAEDNAIEMSEDFDGKLHDGDRKETAEDEEDDKSESEDEELDKQMGDLGDAEADKLDERLWGDDDDDDEDENSEDKMDETGPGMDEGNSELVAKDDNLDASSKNKEKKYNGKEEEKADQGDDKENSEKVHEQIDEREYDENEVDPYHGKQEKTTEPEPLDLPNELNLENDEVEENEKGDGEGEENPYEIEEKPMATDDTSRGEEKNEDEGPADPEKDGQEPANDEVTSENEKEGEIEGDNGIPEDEGKEASKESAEVEKQHEEETKTDVLEEDTEKALPSDHGSKLPEEEPATEEEDIPECLDRMEHESSGKTAEENLQSESAVEQAGAASEKDQAKEEHGSGAADANQSEGHESNLMARLASQKQSTRQTQSFKRKLGEADNERSLGDHSERVQKRLRMVKSSGEEKESTPAETKVEEADFYEHMKEGTESYDAQTYDVASKEQQTMVKPSNDKQEDETDAENTSMEVDEKNEDLKAVPADELKPDDVKSSDSKIKGSDGSEMEIQGPECEKDKEDRKENVPPEPNEKLGRSKDSTVHTAYQFLTEITPLKMSQDSVELRVALEKQLEAWQALQPGSPDEEKAAAEMWQQYLLLTASLSQQLCEQLRLILEPTQASKLKGDYRTGKRLNMRKVIPYIASQFRKDKIWLRRTKPSKRQYQICMAIDDSSSMVDNHSKQLAFESLAVIGNALTLLEVGQIAVCSFGESVQLLHPFHEQFSDQSGARILRLCKFQQKKTRIAQFLESSANMFIAAQQLSQSSSPETAQLLLIVSDGRGLFLEGKERVTAAVQSARNASIFVIFVILDNPNSRDSIMDIKVPVFTEAGEMPEIRSYMDEFPFPFYIILRDVNALPETLSDALRQWFELVTASDHQ